MDIPSKKTYKVYASVQKGGIFDLRVSDRWFGLTLDARCCADGEQLDMMPHTSQNGGV